MKSSHKFNEQLNFKNMPGGTSNKSVHQHNAPHQLKSATNFDYN
jgi:hypothetical protein